MSSKAIILRPQTTQEAEAEIRSAIDWLDSISSDASERFAIRLREEITALCLILAEEIAQSENGRMTRPENAEASIYFSRPVYRHSLETGKHRQRRSSAGLWYIFFAVTDEDADGTPDTLRIFSVRHSARPSLAISASEDV